ncbi:MAG: putative toxin-antitoxin system toxin component, PIN family [Candidatus Margulisbacteria bacterium]|nr:putative toxin-antitoxin system toxin component, PIN family [Candidatus Margulisiibacteriota bacterium]
MKKRAVLDTNVFISALKKGKLRKILDLWMEDRFDVLVSDKIIKEVFEVLKRPKFNFSSLDIEELGTLIFERARIFNSEETIRICDDPDDNKFIECAVAGKANFIVSGDKDLLRIQEYQEIRIIAPSDFIKELR